MDHDKNDSLGKGLLTKAVSLNWLFLFPVHFLNVWGFFICSQSHSEPSIRAIYTL